MSYPIFPDIDQILGIIMAELPQGVYATDLANDPNPANRSNSSSELRAHATVFANLYSNLQDIYSDTFISTVTPEGLPQWEVDLFSSVQDSMQSYATRQSNLLAKYRASGGISLPAIASVIEGVLGPLGLAFAILPYSGQNNGTETGAWILGISELGLDTWLALEDPLLGTGLGVGETPLDCSLNYVAAGLTLQDLENIQATAYTYEVQIYGNASPTTLALLDKLLTEFEPARSTHIITNNAIGPAADPDILDLGPFVADTLTNNIDCGIFTAPPATYDVWDFGSF